MTTKEKPGLKSKIAAKAAQLVNDLNAVRSAVMNKDRPMSPAEYTRLEPRLFESWVIERLAENECLLLAISQQFTELREEVQEELASIRAELKGINKSLAKAEKKQRKEK